ncbi:MAG: energy transducer TonB [Bdellovibrionota bacterium]
MLRSTLLSVLLHLGCAAALYGAYRALPTRSVVLYVEPVWEGAGSPLSAAAESPAGPDINPTLNEAALRPGSQKAAAAAGGNGSRTVSVDTFLARGENQAPQYPEEALTRGWEGEVEVAIRFVEGVPEVSVARSSGYSVLDEEAVRTARSWRLPDGMEGENTFSVPIEFTLRPPSEAGGE